MAGRAHLEARGETAHLSQPSRSTNALRPRERLSGNCSKAAKVIADPIDPTRRSVRRNFCYTASLLVSLSPFMADTVVAAAERTLPHNLEAERSVLGAILVHNDAFNLAAQVIDSRRLLSRRAPAHLRQDGRAQRAQPGHRLRHAEGGAVARAASSTTSAGRRTSRRWPTACRVPPTSSTTRASSRRSRRCAT